MESKRVIRINNLYVSMLTTIFVLAYVVFATMTHFNVAQDILFFLAFLNLYLIFLIFILDIKRSFLFLDNILIEAKRNTPTPISEIEDPIVSEIIKEITVEEPKEIKKEKKYKFYGSTDAKTYHLEKCRFSGMIKQKYLVQKNTSDYFKKNKFHPCGNCKPNRK